MSRQERILSQLSHLKPSYLKVDNDSSKHRGHAEHLGETGYTGETHYKIEISSPEFQGLSRIDIHRKINDLLKAEFESGLHALEIKIAKTPAIDP